jgi:hypothetical protein
MLEGGEPWHAVDDRVRLFLHGFGTRARVRELVALWGAAGDGIDLRRRGHAFSD